jgi:hypothetical protein
MKIMNGHTGAASNRRIDELERLVLMGKQWCSIVVMSILLGCGGEAGQEVAKAEAVEDLGGITVSIPDGWDSEPPSNSMRKAQYRLSGDGGDAELVVTHFGMRGAGGVDVNIARWKGQFADSDGGKIRKLTVSGMNVTVLDISGTFKGMGGPMTGVGTPVTGQRMLAAIVESPKGAFYLKLVGPVKTIGRWESTFDRFIGSVKASGGRV